LVYGNHGNPLTQDIRSEEAVSDTRTHIGRYEVTGELGRGAQGVVYAATDPVIGRQVAIKTIRLDAVESDKSRDELTKRIFREAQTAGKLAHPGIITIHDVGEIENDAYIVMEFVAGRTLEEVLESGIPQHSETLFSILRQAAAALDYAHSKGIVHRDIKPSNIMICNDGTVKISDFGIAKITASASMTQTGFVLGTPNYMSPEQAQGLQLDGSSDQFSLAVVAFRMMSGKLPFQGPTVTALLMKILWEEPEYDSSGLRAPLRHTFKRALSKNPQMRFPNCTDFVKAVEAGHAQAQEEIKNKITESMAKGSDAAETVTMPIPDSAPEKHVHVDETIIDSGFASQLAKAPSQAQEVHVDAGEESIPTPDSSPEIPIEAKKKKSPLIAWAAILGAVVLVGAVFLIMKMSTQEEQPQVPTPEAAVPAESKTAQPDQAVATTSAVAPAAVPVAPKKSTAVQKKASTTEAQKKAPTEPTQTAISQTPNPEERRAEPAPAPASLTGTITWTGKLGKNAILVISGQKASFGTIEGEYFPGKPVQVEVEPKEIVIRQHPTAADGWQQIILYSGKEKYSSITIRWKTTQ
jgi:serine/threonine protein kinase